MIKPCSHSQTKIDTKTGGKPRHVCLLCGLILNSRSNKTEPKKKDASNTKEEKV